MELHDLLDNDMLEFCSTELYADNGIEFDQLLQTISDRDWEQLENESSTGPSLTHAPPSNRSSASSTHRSALKFTAPKTEKQILEQRMKGVPVKMQEDTKYCIRLWEEWSTSNLRRSLSLHQQAVFV